MKTVIYARVSSKEQEEEGYSIEAQIRLLNEYALKNKFDVIEQFIDVETAKKAGRQNFNLMIELLKENKEITSILCEKTDRLYRNFKDYVTVDDLGIEIHFVKEGEILNKDSKSHQKLIHGIKVLMAKNYIDNLSEETRKGMLEKAEQGIYPSAAPMGYKNTEITSDGKTIRSIIPDERIAPFINKLFKMYATGDYSLSLLTKNAYDEGLRNRNGNKIGKSEVYTILRNPVYYGYFRWKNNIYQGNYPSIITKELFDNVQAMFNAQNKPKQTKRNFAYTGLMVCGKCGCAITAEIKKDKYIYYHCTGFRGKCGNTYIREEELSNKFAEIVKNIQISEDLFGLIKNTLLESHDDELEFHKKQVDALNIQKTKIENRLHQIYIDKIDGKVSEDFYVKMMANWQEELRQIKETISRHETADARYLTQGIHILELCNKSYDLYLQQKPEKRVKLLQCLLSNCALDNATLCPTYRKPFDIIAKGLSRSNWLRLSDEVRNYFKGTMIL